MHFIISVFLIFSARLWSDPIISVYAVNTQTNEVVADFQSDTNLIPASCLKIATTAAALHLLGPDAEFQTTLEIDGAIKNGVLEGNIWICGGGDPCLGSGRVSPSLPWEEQIDLWAKAVVEQGIKEIQGKIIGDDTRWERHQAPSSWAWEDLGNYYGAGASALSFHENAYTISFAPGKKEGAPTTVLQVVPQVLQTIRSEVKTGPVNSGDQACIYGTEFSTMQVIRGTIPAGVPEFSIRGSIPDSTALCEKLLSQALEERGIQIQGLNKSDSKRLVIHTTHSPKIRDIVYWTNRKSINLYAEHLLKKLGETMHGQGSTESGIQAVLEFWQGQGIERFNMVDGSGLSRKNFITTKQLVAMLIKIKQAPYFSVFFESLPQIKEGIRAKDGYMSSLRGYVGYKGDVAFAILINHYTDREKMVQEVNKIFDSL